ncbi:MAG: metal-dependent transcriptional regulator [Armatimonadetes bacterium]|nr:metal-dependent transcriptional regulator [Armatimonadota bacterium]MDW8153350.1 metal-dependent transcriptional regulator [Armatimonadota bacterium]
MWVTSRRIEEYLRALLHLQARGGKVSLTALARQMGVSPPTAHEMVRRLEHMGLVTYSRREGIRLTPEGSRRAFGKERRYRLSQRFLRDVLGMEAEVAAREAVRFERGLSPTVEQQIIRLFAHARAPQTEG